MMKVSQCNKLNKSKCNYELITNGKCFLLGTDIYLKTVVNNKDFAICLNDQKLYIQGIYETLVTPIDAVKDAATLGGVLTGEEESYTGKRLRKAKENAENAYDKLDEDEV